jgi:hypothetical protein
VSPVFPADHGSGAEGHRIVTLSLTVEKADGGRVFDSWELCECSVAAMRLRLGHPLYHTEATEAETIAAAQAVLRVPVDPGRQG